MRELRAGRAASGRPGGSTYHAETASLVAKHCGSCHAEGAIAPFPPLGYEAVASRAEFVQAMVQTRQMPPWNPDDSGDYQTYENARWLSDADDPGPRCSCFGGAGVAGTRFVAGWAPGGGATFYPRTRASGYRRRARALGEADHS